VSERDISDAWPPRHRRDQETVLSRWRNLLRQEYGLPEEPVPSLSSKPKQKMIKRTITPTILRCAALVLSGVGGD
jgi:hypothetical protein